METSPFTIFVFFLFRCLCLRHTAAIINNITTTQFLNSTELLVSNNARFAMGFFTPFNSSNQYVGIWYNFNTSGRLQVVWVANRNNPVKDSSGVLKISDDGNLELLDGREMVLWSSNVSLQATTASSSVSQLLDTGNLVLLSGASEKIVWQSFEHLTNILVPQTRILIDNSLMNQALDQEEHPILQSWKNTTDPSVGQFRLGMFRFPIAEFIVRKDDKAYWRSGPWNGDRFLGIPYSSGADFHIVYNKHETILDVSYSVSNESLLQFFFLRPDGNVIQFMWDDGNQKWRPFWFSMESDCDVFGMCGPSGRCNPQGSPICDCLHGFEPKNEEEWSAGNWTSGCVRRTQLSCGLTGPKEDRFLKLKHMKVPFNYYWYQDYDQDACRIKCFETCTCVAYAHSIAIGCMIWEYLLDIQAFPTDGVDLFIRLAHSELEQASNNKKVIIITVTVIIVAATLLAVFIYYMWMHRRQVKKSRKRETRFADAGVDEADFKNLTMFEYEELDSATKNFSNELGKGGFGPVYEGKLENGVAIAVKRLSTKHGQGPEEFLAEVRVISQLRHKYLVTLLGYCLERNEKLLVYEFMPNKSLDKLIFDRNQPKQLSWKERFNIINGICQGLLYLHRFAIVKVIHRDIKANNILLDEAFDPKISDFGLARIFATKQDEDNTSKIAGTKGYMAPEYHKSGLISEKSDVYSLGVLLLEIVSGRRIIIFQNSEYSNLLKDAWKLWNENNTLKLIDPSIFEPSYKNEILKCIHLGLLCVQQHAKDRPTMPDLVSMLDVNDTKKLPKPKKPGFYQTGFCSSTSNEALQSHQQRCSINDVTLTELGSR